MAGTDGGPWRGPDTAEWKERIMGEHVTPDRVPGVSETELREALLDIVSEFSRDDIRAGQAAYNMFAIAQHALASIPAEPEQADLDVERLARALHEDDDGSLGNVEAYRAEAARLAAEYDRLAARDDTSGPLPGGNG